MTSRDKKIDKRAAEIFARENTDPTRTWSAEFSERTASTRGSAPLDDDEKIPFRVRAQQELIAERVISDGTE